MRLAQWFSHPGTGKHKNALTPQFPQCATLPFFIYLISPELLRAELFRSASSSPPHTCTLTTAAACASAVRSCASHARRRSRSTPPLPPPPPPPLTRTPLTRTPRTLTPLTLTPLTLTPLTLTPLTLTPLTLTPPSRETPSMRRGRPSTRRRRGANCSTTRGGGSKRLRVLRSVRPPNGSSPHGQRRSSPDPNGYASALRPPSRPPLERSQRRETRR